MSSGSGLSDNEIEIRDVNILRVEQTVHYLAPFDCSGRFHSEVVQYSKPMTWVGMGQVFGCGRLGRMLFQLPRTVSKIRNNLNT